LFELFLAEAESSGTFCCLIQAEGLQFQSLCAMAAQADQILGLLQEGGSLLKEKEGLTRQNIQLTKELIEMIKEVAPEELEQEGHLADLVNKFEKGCDASSAFPLDDQATDADWISEYVRQDSALKPLEKLIPLLAAGDSRRAERESLLSEQATILKETTAIATTATMLLPTAATTAATTAAVSQVSIPIPTGLPIQASLQEARNKLEEEVTQLRTDQQQLIADTTILKSAAIPTWQDQPKRGRQRPVWPADQFPPLPHVTTDQMNAVLEIWAPEETEEDILEMRQSQMTKVLRRQCRAVESPTKKALSSSPRRLKDTPVTPMPEAVQNMAFKDALHEICRGLVTCRAH